MIEFKIEKNSRNTVVHASAVVLRYPQHFICGVPNVVCGEVRKLTYEVPLGIADFAIFARIVREKRVRKRVSPCGGDYLLPEGLIIGFLAPAADFNKTLPPFQNTNTGGWNMVNMDHLLIVPSDDFNRSPPDALMIHCNSIENSFKPYVGVCILNEVVDLGDFGGDDLFEFL